MPTVTKSVIVPHTARRMFELYIRTLAGVMPGQLALAVTLTVLGALTEGLGLLTLVPLLHLIGIDVQQGTVGQVAGWLAAGFGWLGLPQEELPHVGVFGMVAEVRGRAFRDDGLAPGVEHDAAVGDGEGPAEKCALPAARAAAAQSEAEGLKGAACGFGGHECCGPTL